MIICGFFGWQPITHIGVNNFLISGKVHFLTAISFLWLFHKYFGDTYAYLDEDVKV